MLIHIRLRLTIMFNKLFALMGCIFLISCHQNSNPTNTLRVGTIDGPETQLMEIAKKFAYNQFHLNIKIVPFSDYLQPNAALHDGSLDANVFQHQPWLDQDNKQHQYNLVAVGKTFIYPMGLYPGKAKTLSDIPVGGIISIPNDPSNEGRALLLLQKAGLIQLKKSASIYATPADIEKNPKKLIFKELDSAQLTRSLADVSAAVINTNFALEANLSPAHDALVREGVDSLYANIIVTRKDLINDPRIKELIEALHSPEVIKMANTLFHHEAIPAWKS